MNKLLYYIVFSLVIISMYACNDQPKKEEPGVSIEGKKGGGMEVDKDKLQIEGKKGGALKIDSNGVKVKDPNANK